MGSLLAMSGAAGQRFILPNARHMIHQPLGGASGQATDVEIQARELLRWKSVLTDIYVTHTKQQRDILVKDMERDCFMTATEAVAYGLADKMLTNRA
jgi:ATP-dependent Clp protease protease subunit